MFYLCLWVLDLLGFGLLNSCCSVTILIVVWVTLGWLVCYVLVIFVVLLSLVFSLLVLV